MLPEEFTAFVKEKGFIYPSSDIYGGLAGFYDYGHNGTKLKRKFEDAWRKFFLSLNDNFFEIETANIKAEKDRCLRTANRTLLCSGLGAGYLNILQVRGAATFYRKNDQ